ncbi:MAG: hypothetical protein P1P84_03430 [Deferrisomatales bacterium]|nr:hypothetical protein [Deferrisomatales bacterium]
MGLVLTGALLAGAVPARAVVQARSPGDAPPRVTAQVQGIPTLPPGTVGLLPLGDAPRRPGTGLAVGEALCTALASRGSPCKPLPPPLDATGKPIPGGMVSDAQLLDSAREAGVAVALTGRVTLFDVEASWLPGLTVWRKGLALDIPPGAEIRTDLTFQLRTVAIETGRLLCSAQVLHGPVERLPQEALAEAAAAVLEGCFGPTP